mmetsp:Transcript_27122/g.40789  ORF Transcript_27122/g.40789 Transcript_27122/m.40789 type:complete len:604 (+) Transcript_27122:628-2439(+)
MKFILSHAFEILLVSSSLTNNVLSFTPSLSSSLSKSLLSMQKELNNRQKYAHSHLTILKSTHEKEDTKILKDEAPCYDGICSSEPEPPQSSHSHQGQATQRLGVQSGPTVWSEFGRIASSQEDIANLGQGFPDWTPPKFAIDALVESAVDVTHNSPHQYTRTAGHPKLVNELAGRYSKHLRREIDPMAEVSVTVGASQALYLALQTLIQPGDEVILFEPFFDLYVNQIKLAGGTPVYVPLKFQPYNDNDDDDDNDKTTITPGEWILEPQSLVDKISPKTRAIILNSPHNPTGKIFTRSEMEHIASAITDHASPQCVVLSDEVYKYIVHSPPREEMEEEEAAQIELTQQKNGDDVHHTGDVNGFGEKYKPTICQGHVHFASLPGMWERTITISSAGKTFSATGWQVGWAIGPKDLIAPMHQLLPYVQFCASTVVQEALARALPKADLPYEGYASYYEYLKAMYTRKRDLLGSALKDAGFAVPDYDITPGGGFFIFARIGKKISDAIPPERIMAPNVAAPGNIARKDWALCQWMAEEKGILCIPASPFFSEETVTGINGEPLSDQFVRIAFCKTNETIHKAADRLMKLSEEQTVVDETLISEKSS